MTTIQLKDETKEALRRLGAKGESYDDIVRNLLKEKAAEALRARWDRILEEDEFINLEDL